MTDLAGKRVLVTGGAGFLGSFVQEQLDSRDVGKLIVPRSRDYDLIEQADVRRLFDTEYPDIIIHLAAEVGGIGANRENPGRYFYANMAMGLHVIEEAAKHGIEKVVQVGTVCAYPKFASVPFKEDDLWKGYPEETNAPYGVAKKALLVMLQGYREQYGLNGIYLLPVNLYGPRDNFDLHSSHVIPALIRKFVAARNDGREVVDAWGTGNASREFLYVEDAARAIVAATEEYDGSEPVNVGTSHEITIRELTDLVASLTGFAGTVRWDATKPDGQPRRKLDTTRAEEYFGFTAEVALEEGLKRTIAWYEETQVGG